MAIFVTVACCERCWLLQEGEWEDDGEGRQVLIGVRLPLRTYPPVVDRCVFCTWPTISGIYLRFSKP